MLNGPLLVHGDGAALLAAALPGAALPGAALPAAVPSATCQAPPRLLTRRAASQARQRPSFTRRATAWATGVAGLLAYNWWALVPLRPGLLRSPDEFFSNLEVTGHPYATLMQRADALSGLLLLVAFLVAGSRSNASSRKEWLGMAAFAVAAGLGGLFPQVCTDGISATCLSLEWQFRLPASQYVHDGAGIIEFAGITFALGCAVLRTRGERTPVASGYRCLAAGAVLGYPFLILAFLADRLGGVVEAVFFAGFTAIVVTQLIERTRRRLPRVRAQSAGGTPSDGEGEVVIRDSSDGAARAGRTRQRGRP